MIKEEERTMSKEYQAIEAYWKHLNENDKEHMMDTISIDPTDGSINYLNLKIVFLPEKWLVCPKACHFYTIFLAPGKCDFTHSDTLDRAEGTRDGWNWFTVWYVIFV